MTDQVSGIEMDDEEKKSGHLASIRAAAGLTEEDIEDRVEVFERVQWASVRDWCVFSTACMHLIRLVNCSAGE